MNEVNVSGIETTSVPGNGMLYPLHAVDDREFEIDYLTRIIFIGLEPFLK
jgi:hypothetical protein